MSVLKQLIQELSDYPELALELSDTLAKIAGPWEESNGELCVRNLRGEELAHIGKAYPKWKIVINGETSKEAPFIMHAKDTLSAKLFVEEKLKESGFIIRPSKQDE